MGRDCTAQKTPPAQTKFSFPVGPARDTDLWEDEAGTKGLPWLRKVLPFPQAARGLGFPGLCQPYHSALTEGS